MTAASILQFVLYGAVLLALTPLLGGYMARVFAGERVFLTPVLGPVEGFIYGLCGVRADREQHWTAYTAAMLAFNLLGMLLLYALLRLQAVLPLNPADMPPVAAHMAFNTAVSFTSNTNWQVYGGEATLGYLAQMAGLTVQNFVSAATGIALLLALIRGFARRSSCTVGNFYVDLVRATLYLLLPLSLVGALFLVCEGMPQNLNDYVAATTVEGGQQIIAQGPVASQIAIKQLGTNGGGFFNANSAHPYENPTPLSNFFQVLCILLIPAAQVYMFGRMVGDVRQGWALYAAMAAVFVAFLGVTYWAEARGNPVFEPLGVTMAATDLQAGGNMEGKEVRHGVTASALWAVATTAASNGSVNAMHDSYTPLGGMMPLANIMLGEQIFGGVGAGLYGMLIFVVLTVFIAGLMVGRTPEYLGKKIEAREVKLAVLAILTLPVGILGLGGLAAALPIGVEAVQDPGPHGLSEILYAYSSGTGNNGSAFAGFGAATPYHATMVGLAMLIGRYLFVIPMMAVAGSLAAKKTVPASGGTFPTHTPLFVVLLIGVIGIVGGLTFFPALALGPIAEELALRAGRLF